jgi:hypothetical protein
MATAARPPFQITFQYISNTFTIPFHNEDQPMTNKMTKHESLLAFSDTVKILSIIFFFCIFPPISFLIILLWIIDEIRAR